MQLTPLDIQHTGALDVLPEKLEDRLMLPISNVVKVCRDILPEAAVDYLSALRHRRSLTSEWHRRKWAKRYRKFNHRQRQQMMLAIADFGRLNRPMCGYYFEFGSFGGHTMRLAWDNLRWLFDWHFVSFDSFEGLPEIAEIDRQAIWQQGKLKITEQDFIAIMLRHGIPRERFSTVKGFYGQSLTLDLQARLLPTKAAVIYVDCDLYQSTIPALAFCRPFFQRGTVVVFDDWTCFHSDPDKGERRAFREFRAQHPELRFEKFMTTSISEAYVCLDPA